jgi:hypothetical protein
LEVEHYVEQKRSDHCGSSGGCGGHRNRREIASDDGECAGGGECDEREIASDDGEFRHGGEWEKWNVHSRGDTEWIDVGVDDGGRV